MSADVVSREGWGGGWGWDQDDEAASQTERAICSVPPRLFTARRARTGFH